MPGIIVGIDGSDRSRQALEWAGLGFDTQMFTPVLVAARLPGGPRTWPANPGSTASSGPAPHTMIGAQVN
jgi:hypothetical protein